MTARSLRPWLLAFLLLLPSAARAQGKVQVTVHVIHASKAPGKVDPRLAQLKKQLAAFAFRSYTLHRVQVLTLALGATGEVDLPGARTLFVTPKGRDAQGKLKVHLRIDKVVDATYLIANGGTLIVGGPRHGEGTMILAITQSATR